MLTFDQFKQTVLSHNEGSEADFSESTNHHLLTTTFKYCHGNKLITYDTDEDMWFMSDCIGLVGLGGSYTEAAEAIAYKRSRLA